MLALIGYALLAFAAWVVLDNCTEASRARRAAAAEAERLRVFWATPDPHKWKPPADPHASTPEA